MSSSILVSAAELEALLDDGRCIAVDCRFELSDPDKGRALYREGHIPGAVYADLDRDLSSPVTEQSGRHPLPDSGRFAAALAAAGWSPGKLLVAYDEKSNAIASRLWWLMRYFDQPAALLDGGLAAWIASGRPLETGGPAPSAGRIAELRGDERMSVSTGQIERQLGSGEMLVLDARASERFTGAVETLDSRAGHIPGAINRPFGANLEPGGRFKDPDQLRSEYATLLGGIEPAQMIHSCGSGVTACHNLFAMELAGLSGSRLYPGSWSEWIRDPERPIATGEAD